MANAKIDHPKNNRKVPRSFVAFGRTKIGSPVPVKCVLKYPGGNSEERAVKVFPKSWLCVFKGVGDGTGLTLELLANSGPPLHTVKRLEVAGVFGGGPTIHWPPTQCEEFICTNLFVPYGTYTSATPTVQTKDGSGNYKPPSSPVTAADQFWFAEFSGLQASLSPNCELKVTEGAIEVKSEELVLVNCPDL